MDTNSRQANSASAPRWWRSPVVLFLVLGVALVAATIAQQWSESRKHVADEHDQIAAIGELKAKQIELWLESQGDVALSLRAFRGLREDVAALGRRRDPAAERGLHAGLEAARAASGAAAIIAIDAGGKILGTAGERTILSAWLQARVNETLQTGVARLNVLHRDSAAEGGGIHLDYIVTIPSPGRNGSVVGLLLLRQDPAASLFRFVQAWPVSSPSAESMLVRRDGESLLFLNELRHRAGTAFSFRLPLEEHRHPAVQIVEGGGDRVRGPDYRGKEVLAFGRRLQGTDWYLVAKVDTAEVLAAMRRELAISMLLILGFTLLAGVGATVIWRQQDGLAELRRRALQAERDALDEHLQMLSRYANDIILLLDDQGVILNANERAYEAYGYPRGGIIGLRADHLRPAGDRGFDAAFQRILEEGNLIYETLHVRKDGAELPVEISARRIDADGQRFVQAIIRDISERKRAQREIEYKNRVLATQQDSSLDAILVVDENARIVSYNRRFIDLWRIPEAMVRAGDDRPVLEAVVAQMRDPAAFVARVRHLYDHRDEVSQEEIVTRDGRIVDRHSAPVTGADGRYYGRVWYFRDITARRQAEQALRESEERFRAMIEQSISGTCIIDKAGRFVYVNPRLAEILGYDSFKALVGRPVLEFVAPASHAVIRANLRERLAGEPQRERYHFQAVRRDGSQITLGAHGSPGVYRGEKVLITTVQDVTEIKRAEDEVQRTVAKLERTLQSTIEVISTIGELRDPYTHGHEHRVGELAAAVAVEMGLGADRVEGIRVAGYMHDVGKIAVPAEILVKPTRLTPAEYELVKGHAQQGYDILKSIDFPWPVAQMVLQHHERLDGSGYPQKLRGDEILPEARVLAVADTVEAMASHRPYRPGLGLEKALAEIERGKGSIYEARVVDACLRLFREKGYQLPG